VRTVVGTLAVLSLAAHLAFLPPALEDLDSVNFALGVRQFDVAHHQPHPPGYPLFIALAKIGTSALRAAGVQHPEARGLAIWSAIAAGLLPIFLFIFFRAIDPGEDGRRALIATMLTSCAPLFWFSGVRPLSDLAGLAAACASLALVSREVKAKWFPNTAAPPSADARPSRALLAGAFLAGAAIGFRSQMALLTLPLLLVALVASRHRFAIAGAAAAGVAFWAVPLILLSGGPAGYVHALGSQAGEDFSGVVMLWTNRSVRVAIAVCLQTFVRPWDSPVLAGVMLALAAAGLVVLFGRSRRTLTLLLITFAPYAIFHILFQETVTLRYALPILPLVCYLAATSLDEANAPAAVPAAGVIAAVGLVLAVPATRAFAATPSPIFSLLDEMRLLGKAGANPIIGMHRRVFTESRRARLFDGDPPGRALAAPRDYEWLELTRAWREGYDGEVWFVADPRRTDLALIDSEHARTREYRWPFKSAVYAGGARPDELDWHVLSKPGWFLEHGWALTPEIAGITERDNWGPHRRPSLGWVRRRAAESLMTIGGRHLGGETPATITVSFDDHPITALEVKEGFFLQMVPIAAGTLSGEGRFARLTVVSRGPNGAPSPRVAIEQFNLQALDRPQFGFDDGWYEPEYNPTTARSWRWMSDRANVRIHSGGRPVTLTLRAESPLRYFKAAPHVTISAGSRVLAELTPTADFTMQVTVPPDVLAAANDRLTVTSDRVFVPGDRDGSADRRRLALRVYSVKVGDTQ
jgi:hypothetical protein